MSKYILLSSVLSILSTQPKLEFRIAAISNKHYYHQSRTVLSDRPYDRGLLRSDEHVVAVPCLMLQRLNLQLHNQSMCL